MQDPKSPNICLKSAVIEQAQVKALSIPAASAKAPATEFRALLNWSASWPELSILFRPLLTLLTSFCASPVQLVASVTAWQKPDDWLPIPPTSVVKYTVSAAATGSASAAPHCPLTKPLKVL